MNISTVTVKTNGHSRDLKSYADLPLDERDNFDYILNNVPTKQCNDPENFPDECYSTRFFEYRGSWYDVQEFSAIVRVTDYPGRFFTGLTVSPDSEKESPQLHL